MIIHRQMQRTFKRLPMAALAVTGLVLGLTGEVKASPGNALTDPQICDAVEDRLFMDHAVPFDRIDAKCSDGIVTLTGHSRNILAKERAARLAETIKGVRAIVNRVDVTPLESQTTAELQNDIEAALLADPVADSYELGVQVSASGEVVLTGSVDSWHEKKLAANVVKGVNGVTSVENRINVAYDTDRPEHEIKPEIEKALRWNALVDESFINVEVSGRRVMLTGTVGSLAEKRQANYESWVAGVRHVDDSKLKIHDWAENPHRRRTNYPTISEDETEDAVVDANLYDPRVNSFQVTPEVTGSIVVLRGTVDNIDAKRAAERNARNTVGVSFVRNRIKVRPTMDRADSKIEEEVHAALLRDPFVDRYEINVHSLDGTVLLTGAVDSYAEKAQAEDVAGRVKGVISVSNALTVSDGDSLVLYEPYTYDYDIYDYGWYDYDPRIVSKPDDEIERAIEDELWWSPYVDSDEIDVSVDDGTATLTGTVDSWLERRAARENCLEAGAIEVMNRLKVRYH